MIEGRPVTKIFAEDFRQKNLHLIFSGIKSRS